MVNLLLRLEQLSGFKIFGVDISSTSNSERSGQPVDTTTSNIIIKIHDLVMNNRRLQVLEILLLLWSSPVNALTFDGERAAHKVGAAIGHSILKTRL